MLVEPGIVLAKPYWGCGGRRDTCYALGSDTLGSGNGDVYSQVTGTQANGDTEKCESRSKGIEW